MINHKSPQQISLMRQSGLLTWQAHQKAKALIRPGITTKEIDEVIEAFFLENGAQPLFKGVRGVVPFPAATCISVNEEVVHGIPGPRVLQEGDIVSVDTGCRWHGWCSDAAVTHAVGQIDSARAKLLQATEDALSLAICQMRPGIYWSHIARQMERSVAMAGCMMIRANIHGHGIGRQLHEDPTVPNYVLPSIKHANDFRLHVGMVIAVEPMVALSSSQVQARNDYWTIVSSDGSAAAHFEHTIALTEEGPVVMTAGPQGEGWAIKM
jgi:methionyl aminopeptidase